MSLAMIVPSKGRPENAERLVQACEGTVGYEMAALIFAVDYSEPRYEEYEAVRQNHQWIDLMRISTMPQRVGPIINRVSVNSRYGFDHIGFMGDDHLPRTPLWDEELIHYLNGKPGVAYGNDLFQGERIPTAAILSSRIIQVLGYMVPTTLEHLYLDDYWKMLGTDLGNLVYRPEVVIEHLHPAASKAQYDQVYTEANSAEQYSRDGEAWGFYRSSMWPGELARLKKGLGLV